MVFGELVIPSSRALWDDECTKLEEYEKETLDWEGSDVSLNDISSLYVADTLPVIRLFEECILKDLKPVKISKKAGLRIYELGDKVVVLYENKPLFTTGEIIQDISTLIEKAKNIYGISSTAIALYQSDDVPPELSCFIRTLSTKNVKSDIQKLQIPNLVTGLTANLLSYCIHVGLDCQLFIGFLDTAPLDSTNTEPFFKLFNENGLSTKTMYNSKMQLPPNNLYM